MKIYILCVCVGLFIICPAYSVGQKCLVNDKGVAIRRHFYVGEHDLPLRIEVSNRITHQLVSNIFKILLTEVIGYPKVLLSNEDYAIGDNATVTLQKISSCINPKSCQNASTNGPEVMINLEVWLVPGFNMGGWIATGEVEDCGPLGPIGRSGWYIADYAVKEIYEVNGTIIDHYRAFQKSDVAVLFDLSEDENLYTYTRNLFGMHYCHLEECNNGTYKPPQCKFSKCATLLADYPASTFDVLKHEIIDLKLFVTIVWVGPHLQEYVKQRTIRKKYTLFFHKKPSLLSSLSNFTHISFPHCEDNAVTVCEFEVNQMEKVAWSKVKTNAPHAFHLLRAMSFTQKEYLQLLDKYYREMIRGRTVEDVACQWVIGNSIQWYKWIPDDLYNKTMLYIGGIFPMGGTYWKQSGVIPAAHMAVDAINRKPDLLENYNLAILEQDGHCVSDEVMKSFINYVTNSTYKTMVGILGPACSDTVEPIAGVAKHFNTIIISYSAEGALFSNREKYPYFFRTIPENNQLRFVYLQLFQKLGWHRVAALTEDGQKYPEYISHLQDLMLSNGMNFIVNRKFPRERVSLNMIPYLEELKAKGARIIIGDFYDYAARAVMCDAYKLGMTASNGYQWFLPLWYTSDWFDTDLHNSVSTQEDEHISCSTDEMIEAINGHMSLAYKFYADDDAVMQETKTVKEWTEQYEHQAKLRNMDMSRYGGFTYDAVWVYAYALDKLFKENNSHVANLHSTKTSRRLVDFISQTNFTGVTGPLYFIGSSRISEVVIWQWLKNTTHQVGVYHSTSQEEGELKLNETRIVWLTANGHKPGDGSSGRNACPLAAFSELFDGNCEMAIVTANIIGFSIFALLMLSGVVIFKRRYERRMKMTEARMRELGLIASSGMIALDEWEMPRDHIVINRKLGEGAFGTVFGGEAFLQDKGWIAVAVKTLKSGAKSEEKLDFLGEAEVMKQFDHINVVRLIGVCTMGEPVYTVMEFMLYGDLKTFLLSRRNLVTEDDGKKSDEVSDRRLTNMALDVARGLSYLANLKFVHRDLACRNCLVNSSRTVKIADFGMCRAMYDSDYYRFHKKGMLPVRWMAPESLIDGLFTPMSDVWSYGVLLYEIVTFGSFPYQGLSNNQVLEYLKNYNTLSVPKGCKPELEALLIKCWAKVPHLRPQAAEIVEILANHPDLISPCLDMPIASVEVEGTDSLELTIHDRSRVHSVSSMWQGRKNLGSSDHTPNGFASNTIAAVLNKQTEPQNQKDVKNNSFKENNNVKGHYVFLMQKGIIQGSGSPQNNNADDNQIQVTYL